MKKFIHEANKPILNSYLILNNEILENKEKIIDVLKKSEKIFLDHYKNHKNKQTINKKLDVLFDWYCKQFKKLELYLKQEQTNSKQQILLKIKNIEKKGSQHYQKVLEAI